MLSPNDEVLGFEVLGRTKSVVRSILLSTQGET